MFSGCSSTSVSTFPSTEVFPSSPQLIATQTTTPSPTLQAAEVEKEILALLQDSTTCASPCFWDIYPDVTSLGEVQEKFSRLGRQFEVGSYERGGEAGAVYFDLQNRVSIEVALSFEDDVVNYIHVGIVPQEPQEGGSHPWSAYALDKLILHYGVPSEVGFSVGTGAGGGAGYAVYVYFPEQRLFVEYVSHELRSLNGLYQICPLISDYHYVSLWFGRNADDFPMMGMPLEEATTLTREEFSEVITGDSSQACLTLDPEQFQ